MGRPSHPLRASRGSDVVEHCGGVLGVQQVLPGVFALENSCHLRQDLELIEAPPFEMEADWSMHQMIGYMSTWSAVRAFREATGVDPVAGVREEIAEAWGDPQAIRRVRWPIHLRLGRIDTP